MSFAPISHKNILFLEILEIVLFWFTIEIVRGRMNRIFAKEKEKLTQIKSYQQKIILLIQILFIGDPAPKDFTCAGVGTVQSYGSLKCRQLE